MVVIRQDYTHCVESVQIRSFFWSVFSRIQSECGKIQIRKTLYLDTFHAVKLTIFQSKIIFNPLWENMHQDKFMDVGGKRTLHF